MAKEDVIKDEIESDVKTLIKHVREKYEYPEDAIDALEIAVELLEYEIRKLEDESEEE